MINKERMTEHVMDIIRIDSLSKKEKDVALKLQKDMEEIGAECFYDDAGEKVNGNVGNLIVKLEGNKPDAPPFSSQPIWILLDLAKELNPELKTV